MIPPTTQKAGLRPISFLLDNGITGLVTNVDLVIRPEDLTRVAPSRLSAIQTFGGAWIDNFGPGLATIQISGHLGWRGGLFADGETLFDQLKTTIFDQWHAQRAAAVAAGQDPSKVQLIFSDALDNFVNVVAPTAFTLKRNRSRPLLKMYQIAMIVTDEVVGQPNLAPALNQADVSEAGVDSLSDSVNSLLSMMPAAQSLIDQTLGSPIAAKIGIAAIAFGEVLDEVGTGAQGIGAIDPIVLGAATAIALSARNAMFGYLANGALALESEFLIMNLAAIFENALCILNNVFIELLQYPDFSDIYGASICSSTAGGSPLSPLRFVSALALVAPAPTTIVSVTPAAQGALTQLSAMDPILAPPPNAQISALVTAAAGGVSFQ